MAKRDFPWLSFFEEVPIGLGLLFDPRMISVIGGTSDGPSTSCVLDDEAAVSPFVRGKLPYTSSTSLEGDGFPFSILYRAFEESEDSNKEGHIERPFKGVDESVIGVWLKPFIGEGLGPYRPKKVGWSSLSSQPRRKLLKPFHESYKFSKDWFFRVYPGVVGPNLLVDSSDDPFFPLDWTYHPDVFVTVEEEDLEEWELEYVKELYTPLELKALKKNAVSYSPIPVVAPLPASSTQTTTPSLVPVFITQPIVEAHSSNLSRQKMLRLSLPLLQ
ncbi:hypothetical protein CR513_54859, partial [Mucuna pruriens]